MSKYSIILPARNGGALLKECVNSILRQNYADFNLLVLDNNSTDGSQEWLASLHDKRIQVFPSHKDLSIVDNWSRIVTTPKNEFITLIGHDDLLYPNYLSTMDALIQQHPEASLYQAHFNYINGKGAFVRPCLPMDEKQYAHEFIACQLAQTIDSMGTGYMMRSDHFDQLGGMPIHYPNLIFADYALWIKLSGISYKATTNKFCFCYRVHDSVSRLTNGFEYQDAFGQYIHFLHELQSTDAKIANVIEHYAHDYLMYFCESLSHRILKTVAGKRSITVKEYIDKCISYAALLIPGQTFIPTAKKRIRLAMQFDASPARRKVFLLIKKIIK